MEVVLLSGLFWTSSGTGPGPASPSSRSCGNGSGWQGRECLSSLNSKAGASGWALVGLSICLNRDCLYNLSKARVRGVEPFWDYIIWNWNCSTYLCRSSLEECLFSCVSLINWGDSFFRLLYPNTHKLYKSYCLDPRLSLLIIFLASIFFYRKISFWCLCAHATDLIG